MLPAHEEGMPAPDILSSLAGYLTLERAERMYGFEPATFQLTEQQAADIAVGAGGRWNYEHGFIDYLRAAET